ncbi:variant 2, Kinesin-like protein KIN-8A [Lathyrus oleraceus]|uniref:Kinesin-like protein n=1 Tax=Pisum sativum TaxID=3888 RepID=A0A9D5APC2_PEA|nr:variant 2, Kinesin-like protein KIN-8A [Pisum sativum]
MPVSTRSKISTENERNPTMQEQQRLRNPHHGLKEKLKTLTLLYEQQKQASKSLRNSNTAMRERNSIANPNSTITKTFVLPQPPSSSNNDDDAKENQNLIVGQDRIVGFSYPRKVSTTTSAAAPVAAVARRLSMPAPVKGKEEELGKCVSRILVFVRVRPMSKKEIQLSSRCCVRIVNHRDVYLTESANEKDYLRLNRVKGRHFAFDGSFSDSATQLQVYSTTTLELVEAVLQGRNGSVFCYGATGAGKTYTMLGTVENPGVMVLAIQDLFSKIRQRSCDGSHVVHLSYLEVYNETVRDLLCPGRPLVLREDKQGIVAAGLTQYRASSADEVMVLLQQGNQNRTTEPTRANETSSRSHAILQVVVEFRVRDAATTDIVNRVGKLSLIDLAGSERALATDQRTLRSLEGANINRSLLALSSCINALVEGKKHIPYRNSKLTQLLKDSLGGICNTVMIANISPSSLSFGETQNTVHWADRAKEIRLKVSETNEDQLPIHETDADQAKLIHELQKENHEIRMQLAGQQQKLLTLEAQSLASHSSTPPAPSDAKLSTTPTSAQPSEKRRTRSSFLAGTCFTPETKKKGVELAVRTLQRTVKALEAEIERMKKDHVLKLKQKDDLIRELSQKCEKQALTTREVGKREVTRAAGLPVNEPNNVELKSHRLRSPAPTAKKRSFWDITTNNSPSVTTSNGRKTRSHVLSEPTAPPRSMLLQPGFARQKANR